MEDWKCDSCGDTKCEVLWSYGQYNGIVDLNSEGKPNQYCKRCWEKVDGEDE